MGFNSCKTVSRGVCDKYRGGGTKGAVEAAFRDGSHHRAWKIRTYIEEMQLIWICRSNAGREEEQVSLLPRHLKGGKFKSNAGSLLAHGHVGRTQITDDRF